LTGNLFLLLLERYPEAEHKSSKNSTNILKESGSNPEFIAKAGKTIRQTRGGAGIEIPIS
jgi:hypothetical protein